MKIIKVNTLTIYFLLLAFLCGYIKVAFVILGIVIFHELGHVFFIKMFRYQVKEIILYPFGGMTKIKMPLNVPIYQELIIAFGGVFFQLLLFGVLFFPLSNTTRDLFVHYNFSILLFNLLPILPLDGSVIFNAIMNHFFPFCFSYILSFWISILGIVFYVAFNYWYSLNNYLLVVLFLMKTIERLRMRKYLYNQFLLERFLNDCRYRKISTKRGDLSILKREIYQYFIDGENIISEKKKLRERFDKIQ